MCVDKGDRGEGIDEMGCTAADQLLLQNKIFREQYKLPGVQHKADLIAVN